MEKSRALDWVKLSFSVGLGVLLETSNHLWNWQSSRAPVYEGTLSTLSFWCLYLVDKETEAWKFRPMITWSDRWDCSCQYLLSIVSLNWERPGSGIARGKFWEQGLSSCCTLCWLMSWQMSGCPGKMEREEAWCAVFEHRYWDSYSYHQVNPSSYSTWLFDACSFVPCSYSQAPSTFFRPFFQVCSLTSCCGHILCPELKKWPLN